MGDEVALPTGALRVERVDGARVLRLSFTPAEIDQIVDSITEDLR